MKSQLCDIIVVKFSSTRINDNHYSGYYRWIDSISDVKTLFHCLKMDDDIIYITLSGNIESNDINYGIQSAKCYPYSPLPSESLDRALQIVIDSIK